MNKQKPKKRWWVSRDKEGCDFYGIHHAIGKPGPICYTTFSTHDMVACLTGKQFRGMFALRVKKGESKEIERPILVLVK